MMATRFVLVGGFLGAGKTTALAQLARRYDGAGLQVGLITNDQAADLVDTGSLKVRGFRVEEVAGGCFCCRFDDLARAADRLRADERPQVLIGEPVGSCTDLVATVINPIRRLFGGAYRVAPYSVLVDPDRAEGMLLRPGFGGFSSNVAYIFRKQLEEADLILLTKIDSIEEVRAARVADALAAEFPGRTILRVSALTGEGFDAWAAALDRDEAAGRRILDLDYDTYAEGEAELGWLNARLRVACAEPFSADDVVLEILSAVRASLEEDRLEPAHLKVLFVEDGGGAAAAASIVRGGDPGTLTRAMGRSSRAGTLTVNARVHERPETLRARVDGSLRAVAHRRRLTLEPVETRSFSPARPVPVHRDRRPTL